MTRKEMAKVVMYEVGAHLKLMFGRVKEGEAKESELDLVSEADKFADEFIINQIMGGFPEDGIISEESRELPSKNQFRWIIDPLDGTHNFLAGLKEWGTLLALEEKGIVVVGVCYFPALDEFFYAEKGAGAFLNGREIRVSETDKLKGHIFCCDSGIRFAPKNVLGDIERFTSAGCRLRVYGSGAYCMVKVAVGQAVVAANRTAKPWDIAAPSLLVEEAGGLVVDGKGNPWQIDSPSIIATNGRVHKEAFALFQ